MDIVGATNATFTPGPAEVNTALRVVVSYTDNRGTDEQVVSAATNVTGVQITDSAGGENLAGTAGADIINALAGAHMISTGAGSDSVDGGAGNDTVSGGSGADMLHGGADTDTLDYSSDTAGVAVRLWNNSASGGDAAGDVISGVENVIGGSGHDTINGDNGHNVLAGGAGNDFLFALGGNDTVTGGAGNDTVYGGAGADVMDGGDGIDKLDYFTDTAGVTVNLSTGIGSGGEAAGDVISGFENVAGGSGNDRITGDGGANVISGGAGTDTLDGGVGNDTAYGGAGDDVIVAQISDGDDVYYGDSGSDTLDMSAITANITADLGTGVMGRGTVSSLQTGDDVIWSVENIITGSGDDAITASGAVNVMDGGDGDNTFHFTSAQDANGDMIIGFNPGDKLDLGGIDANAGSAGDQSFTIVSGGLSGPGQLMITLAQMDGEDVTLVQGKTTEGAEGDFTIKIKGAHDLTAGDFTL